VQWAANEGSVRSARNDLAASGLFDGVGSGEAAASPVVPIKPSGLPEAAGAGAPDPEAPGSVVTLGPGEPDAAPPGDALDEPQAASPRAIETARHVVRNL
jgi:hypothetical protein